MSKERFIIDFSGCPKMPYWWKNGDPTQLPVVRGKHHMDFDIDVAMVDKGLIERIYDSSVCKGHYTADDPVEEALSIPLGFDEGDVEEFGAKLIRVEDSK